MLWYIQFYDSVIMHRDITGYIYLTGLHSLSIFPVCLLLPQVCILNDAWYNRYNIIHFFNTKKKNRINADI